MMSDLRFAPSAVELVPIERLLPYAGNARLHDAGQIAKIAASIARFGWTVPALVDRRDVLVAGHARLEAARLLGLKEVPVIRLDHLVDVETPAYRITDNRVAEIARWDEAALDAELARLGEDGFDLMLTGFDEDEIALRLDGEAEPGGEDEVPEPPADPVTRPGDLWRPGDHRLLCGDATVATDVERLLVGAVPHLMVTDPPYGGDYDPGWRNEAGVSATARTSKVANDDRADWREEIVQLDIMIADHIIHGAIAPCDPAQAVEDFRQLARDPAKRGLIPTALGNDPPPPLAALAASPARGEASY